jgi:hypothetical protein
MHRSSNPHRRQPLGRASALSSIVASLPPALRPTAAAAANAAPQNPTLRHTAPQSNHEDCKTNPTPPPSSPPHSRPLRPIQLTAARLLLAGQSTQAVAAAVGRDPWTIARWKQTPLFQAELRRQTDALAAAAAAATRHKTPQNPTQRHIPNVDFAKRSQSPGPPTAERAAPGPER